MEQTINYRIFGEGIPFVFQHGLGANISQVERLLGGDFFEGIQWISSDSRGHGKSLYDPDRPSSFDSFADDVISLLDQLKIEKAFFGGISMGSGISINIALRYPDRVKGLVLVRPAWLSSAMPDNLGILFDLTDFLDKKDGQARFEATEGFQKISSVLPMAAKSVLGQFSRDQGEHTADILTEMYMDQPFTNLEDLKSIQKPTLIIGNDADPLHPWHMAEKIHQAMPGSQLKRVPSRYVDNWQHKKAVILAIDEFISPLR